MNSSPLFDFPSFDELFDNQGEFSLSIHPSPVKKVYSGVSIKDVPVQRGVSLTESDKGFEEVVDIATTTEEENEQKQRPSLMRRDSIMMLSFSEMIYRSWEGSKGFTGFRHKLGNNLRHKYCMMCRLHSTIFIFLYILFGIFLTSAGVLCWIQCHGEILVSLYLICDGILSVFFFPIILMDWTKKIGGCVSEKNKNGTGVFWPVTLCTRFFTSIVGTFIIIYRYYLQKMAMENQICEIEYYFILTAVITEWTFLLVVIVIPLVIYAFVYFIAPSLL
ncbi:hypothetical protein KUTeg_017953 [Tegillarca granosa]|uniref:Uncharacterized protein n=1 Tax=Tegillarca granosa TaxID=220873 RepID=A0ABQ9EGP1_TEGGR|nr:hypothetical protein KUTeg_017953 [Tegillarca granosa]